MDQGWRERDRRDTSRWGGDRTPYEGRRFGQDRNRYEGRRFGQDRDRRDGRWGSFFRHHAYSRPFHFRNRYPAYYRYGYFHSHGFYFPRYYYDYDAYSSHAAVRVLVEPDDAEVYVDGYYAGTADDFDGAFQRLNLTPGPHEITLRLDGYVTWSVEIDAIPGETVSLHHDLVPGVGPDLEGYSYDPEAGE